jgi:Mg-chelatase subunit ChlD
MSFRRYPAALSMALLTAITTARGTCAPTAAEPVLMAIALDTSGSIAREEFERTRALAGALLEHLPAGSEAALFTFDDQERLLLPWTSQARDIQRALRIVRPTGRYTALYDGLFAASRHLRDVPAGPKALVLLSDGKDTGSTLTLEDGVRMAQDSRFPVFTIGIGSVHEKVLRRIAKLTGGEYVPLAKA